MFSTISYVRSVSHVIHAMAAARNRKANKLEYLHLLSEIRRKGWEANYSTIKIGALSHYNPDSLSTLSAS